MYLFVPLYLMSCTIKERGEKKGNWDVPVVHSTPPPASANSPVSHQVISLQYLKPLQPVHSVYLCGTYVEASSSLFTQVLWAFFFGLLTQLNLIT